LRSAGVDALFMPHLDFGCEESVGKLAKALQVPFLLWGPRDPAPDPQTGERRTDTQCGLFATGKVLQWLEVPFDHIVNCRVTDPEFATGYERFLRAAAIVKAARGLRIAQFGTRPAAFLSVMCDESELLRRFGIQVVPIPLASVVHRALALAAEGGAELDEAVAVMRSQVDCGPMAQEDLQRLAALRIEVAKAIHANGCSAAAIECWSVMPEAAGILPCYVNGDLAGEGIPVACETDIMGAVSGVLGQAASFDREPTFFADFTQRHPDNDNAELLWHCGPFPHRLRAPGERASMVGCKGQWRLRDGTITLLRLDQLAGRYALSVGKCRTVDGPPTEGTYVWVETENWPRWERRLIRGPGIHHVVGIYGDYVQPLLAACKYLEPGAPCGVEPLHLDAPGG